MAGPARNSGQKQENKGRSSYDFLPWDKRLLFPVARTAKGKKKPMPKRGTKGIRKAVERFFLGRDNLHILGERGMLSGLALVEYQIGQRKS